MNVKVSIYELSCFYWCWCSVHGDFIILPDSLSTSLGIGLSITFKAGEVMLRWLGGGGHSSVIRAPAAKAGGHGLDS